MIKDENCMTWIIESLNDLIRVNQKQDLQGFQTALKIVEHLTILNQKSSTNAKLNELCLNIFEKFFATNQLESTKNEDYFLNIFDSLKLVVSQLNDTAHDVHIAKIVQHLLDLTIYDSKILNYQLILRTSLVLREYALK